MVKLKIANIITEICSKFMMETLTRKEEIDLDVQRFNKFLYDGIGKPDIFIDVNIVDTLPKLKKTKNTFITFHPDGFKENWRLIRRSGRSIYYCPLKAKKQLMVINPGFTKVRAYLLPKENKGLVWHYHDIIYDFLQILLINYLASTRKGIFAHSAGIKDLDGSGLLFAGKSGTGKSTTAKIWHKFSRVDVLNDDRIIIRKLNGRFFIFNTPWHGEFDDYVDSRAESAPLKKLFFIHHAKNNSAKRISQKEAFNYLFPSIFPTFWDKRCLEIICDFCNDLVSSVPCYTLGFVNNSDIIHFVRKVA